EAVVFKFTNFVCEVFNKSRIVINECRLKAISRNTTLMNFNATLLHPLNDVILEAQIFKRANGYKPFLYKARIDCCQFFRKAYHPIVIGIYKTFRNYSNMNHPCPYSGIIYTKGANLEYGMLPHALPTGQYLLNLTWIHYGTKTLTTNLYFMFTEDL
ncbi:hypothetical protein KR093_006395, partial [Drosophila rubida]